MALRAGLNAKETDRVYDVLPLYHSTGGICALGPAFTAGGSLVIRRKFSVTEFWNDIYRYKPTLFQYIGELCRYLLNAPVGPHETDHNIRAITGNGLRPEIWPAFQKRFAIPKIIEFYGATEGNVSMLNYDGKVGAVGRLPWYMRNIIKIRIVRFDVEHEMPVRGAGRLLHRMRRRTKRARPSARSRTSPAAISRAIRRHPKRRRKSCAMFSRRAIPGFAPAI